MDLGTLRQRASQIQRHLEILDLGTPWSPAAHIRSLILVWVFRVTNKQETNGFGNGSANGEPGQKLAPPTFGPRSEYWILKVHNSSLETVTFDDTRVFDTVVTWSTFYSGSLAWIHY